MTITLNINKPINNELFIYIKSKYACKFNSVHFRCNKQEFTLYCSILGSTYKPNEIFDKLDPVENSIIKIQRFYRLKFRKYNNNVISELKEKIKNLELKLNIYQNASCGCDCGSYIPTWFYCNRCDVGFMDYNYIEKHLKITPYQVSP